MLDTIIFLFKLPFLYLFRICFVFSVYILMFFYGIFSNKKKIEKYVYKDGDKIPNTNLIHNFIDIKGVNFHYVSNLEAFGNNDDNNAPTVVLLHGIFESWYSWHKLLALFDSFSIKCIAIDFKNHGNTSAHYAGSVIQTCDMGKNFDLAHQGREILQILYKLGINNVIFVTTDMGSLICDRIIGEYSKPTISGYIRGHEPLIAQPNDVGLPQQYMFWFNKKLSLFLMHNSNEMILRLFYKATGWKVCEPVGATHLVVENSDEYLKNAICPYTWGIYKGCNSNYMSWCGAYAYAFLNDIYTGPMLNYDAYTKLTCPIVVITGEYDNSTKLHFMDGSTFLGYKQVNGYFCSKMIKHDGEDGYSLITRNKNISLPTEYFENSPTVKLVVIEGCGHAPHIEKENEFNQIVLTCVHNMTKDN